MALNSIEREILEECAGLRKTRPWGAAVGAVLEFLRGCGYLSGGKLTSKGYAALLGFEDQRVDCWAGSVGDFEAELSHPPSWGSDWHLRVFAPEHRPGEAVIAFELQGPKPDWLIKAAKSLLSCPVFRGWGVPR